MSEYKEHSSPKDQERISLYVYLIGVFDELPSRKSVKKALDSSRIYLDAEIATTRSYIEGSQVVRLIAKKVSGRVYERKIEVEFEDDHLAIVNKPAGLTSSGNTFQTLQNALSYSLKSSGLEEALDRPQLVHRLDAATSGLMLVAKTHSSLRKLNTMFAEGEVQKTYIALHHGKLPKDGFIDSPIDGRASQSEFQRIKDINSSKYGNFSLVEWRPRTGRKHQLRIHASQLGHPIVGDLLYAEKTIIKKGLFLFASQLHFQHPIELNECDIKLAMPNKFDRLIKWLA